MTRFFAIEKVLQFPATQSLFSYNTDISFVRIQHIIAPFKYFSLPCSVMIYVRRNTSQAEDRKKHFGFDVKVKTFDFFYKINAAE